MSIRQWAAVVAAGLGLAAGWFFVAQSFMEFRGAGFYLAATDDDQMRYAFSSEPTAHPDDRIDSFQISGVMSFELVSECYDRDLYLLILDGATGRELDRRDLRDQPVCEDDRLLWNGEDLVELDDGLVFGLFKDPWPDDVYVSPFWVGSTAEDPVVAEHGFSRRWSFETVGEGLVDGVTQFTPGTTCEPDGFLRTPPYVVRVRDAQTRQVLGSAWLNRDICSSTRLHWNGEQLEVLDPGERLTRLPDDLYEE